MTRLLHVFVTRGDIPSQSRPKSVPGADREEQGCSETPNTSTTCRSLVANTNERSGGQPSNEDGLARVPGRHKVDVFFAHAASAAVRDVPHNSVRNVPRNAKDAPPQDRMTTWKSNTSRSRAGGEQYFNPLIAMQEQVDDEAADQPSNT